MRWARAFARYGYVPAMLLGLNGLAIYLTAAGHSLWWVAPIGIAAFALAFAMERVLPYEAEWNAGHDDVAKDVAHGLVYEINNLTALAVLPIIVMFRPWDGIWPTHWPLALQVLTAILVADCCMSVIHFWSHRINWMWRLHAVHHGVHRLYGFNGLVRHPLHQSLDLTVGTLPLIVAGMTQEVATLLALAISIQLVVQHSNVDYVLGPFRQWLAIGPVHRLHHVNWAGEGDVNFGLFFTVWDKLLGSFRLDSPKPPVAGDIGIQDRPNFPQAYTDQLMLPFEQDHGAKRDKPPVQRDTAYDRLSPAE
jgi:sterol desaturase/sphingolipid hydroxylase (fatty acid hydroxylase superfamily)